MCHSSEYGTVVSARVTQSFWIRLFLIKRSVVHYGDYERGGS